MSVCIYKGKKVVSVLALQKLNKLFSTEAQRTMALPKSEVEIQSLLSLNSDKAVLVSKFGKAFKRFGLLFSVDPGFITFYKIKKNRAIAVLKNWLRQTCGVGWTLAM